MPPGGKKTLGSLEANLKKLLKIEGNLRWNWDSLDLKILWSFWGKWERRKLGSILKLSGDIWPSCLVFKTFGTFENIRESRSTINYIIQIFSHSQDSE